MLGGQCAVCTLLRPHSASLRFASPPPFYKRANQDPAAPERKELADEWGKQGLCLVIEQLCSESCWSTEESAAESTGHSWEG